MIRTPPHSLEAEENVLACILLDNGPSLSTCLNVGLRPEHFYAVSHSTIYSTLEGMLAQGRAIELSALFVDLQTKGLVDSVGGMAHLLKLTGSSVTTLTLSQNIEAIKQRYILRETIRESCGLVEKCFNFSGDLAETLDASVSKLLNLSQGHSESEELSWDKVVAQSETILDTIISQQGLPAESIINFPWDRMNDLFQPMQRGQLVIIGARPSIGKSSLARQMVLEGAKKGKRGYFVTLEVSPERVPLQIASTATRIGLRQVAKAHKSDQESMKQALRDLKGLGITISKRDRTIARIVGRSRALHAKGQLDMLIIDHGLLVEDIANSKKEEMTANISRFTKSLKRLAMDIGIVVVLLWQLNRASARDDNREPNLTDLKDCGSLEEDADKVLLIHRPKTTPEGMEQKDNATVFDCPRFFTNIIQAKGRDDGTSIMSFAFERQIAAFTPIA